MFLKAFGDAEVSCIVSGFVNTQAFPVFCYNVQVAEDTPVSVVENNLIIAEVC